MRISFVMAVLATTLGFASTAKSEGRAVEIYLGARFEPDGRMGREAPVDHKHGYATIQYKIGDSVSREYLRRAITAFTETLPEKFGKSEGAYTITLKVTDASGKELAKEPILTFQWKNERVFFIIDKVVDQIQSTQWSGTLVDDVLVADGTRRFNIGIEVFQTSSRSMDFDTLKRISKLFSEGAMASFLPLPSAASGVIGAAGDIVNTFYANAKKQTLVEAEEVTVTTGTQTFKAPIRFRDADNQRWTLPVTFTISSRQSRYMPDAFDAAKLTVAIAGEKSFTIVTGKAGPVKASLLDLIRTSEAHADVRALLDSLAAKKKYDGDLRTDCGALYGALGNYLSIYDARAVFWAFIKQNGGLIDENACLGGGRREELERIGIKF